MTREKLLKTLITFKCFSDRNLNILLLNKKDVDIKLLNECRDEETSMLIKDYNIIGNRIKQARLAKNMTQEDLADKIDISVAFLSRVERGNSHINLKRLNQMI